MLGLPYSFSAATLFSMRKKVRTDVASGEADGRGRLCARRGNCQLRTGREISARILASHYHAAAEKLIWLDDWLNPRQDLIDGLEWLKGEWKEKECYRMLHFATLWGFFAVDLSVDRMDR